MSINNHTEKKSDLKKHRFFIDGWLHDPAFQGYFKDGCLKTKITLKQNALVAAKLLSWHPVDVQH